MKKIYQSSAVFVVVVGMILALSGIQTAFAGERTSGFSSGVNAGVVRFFDGDLGIGFSGRAFLEYAPYIHEIALRLTGGYFRFQDEITLGQGAFTSEEDVVFEDFYLTGGLVYRFSRGKMVPFGTLNLGVYHYRKEDVSSAVGPVIIGTQVSPFDTVDFREGNDFGVNAGGGLEFFTSNTTSISMELLVHAIFGEVDNQVLDFTAMFRFFPEK